MKTKHYRWVFLAALIPLVVLGFVGQPVSMGVSAGWTDGNYRFAGGTDPFALAYSLVLITLYLLLLYYSELGKQVTPLPGIFRRFVAFWLDFVLALTLLTPIMGILPTVMEWRRTGVFEWSFERTTPAPGDGLLALVGVLPTFVGLAFYYTWPLLRRKPSPGTCIMGYQIIPDDGVEMTIRKALLRTMLGFVATAGWPVAPFIERDRKNGKFWLDKVFRTRAIKLF
jgi:uncharacterized RDD family membrane protein YckC